MIRKIEQIIIHCTDSDDPRHDFLETVKQWHLELGFNDIGYHYLIHYDGNVSIGRNLDIIGAHCVGQNENSIGIALHGKNCFSSKQFKTLNKLLNNLMFAFNIPKSKILPHNHYNKFKTCPNFDLKEVLSGL